MKCIIRLGALGAVLLAVAPAVAAIPSQDHTFAVTAAQGGMAEVQAAHLALQKTHDPDVRAFAQRMLTDHTKANHQLVAIMRSQGLTPPGTIDPMDKTMAEQLSSLSGKAFDAAYLKGQVVAHKRTIALFKKEAARGSDPQIVSFAKNTLPTLDMHLMMVDHDVTASM
jgi:putative membrane protein